MATESAIDMARKALDLAEQATPGPWRPHRHDCGNDYFERHTEDGSTPIESTGTQFALGVAVGVASGRGDASFIAFARTALPILAKAVIEAAGLSPDESSAIGMWLSTHKWNKTVVERHLYDVLERVAAADDARLLSETDKSP